MDLQQIKITFLQGFLKDSLKMYIARTRENM